MHLKPAIDAPIHPCQMHIQIDYTILKISHYHHQYNRAAKTEYSVLKLSIGVTLQRRRRQFVHTCMYFGFTCQSYYTSTLNCYNYASYQWQVNSSSSYSSSTHLCMCMHVTVSVTLSMILCLRLSLCLCFFFFSFDSKSRTRITICVLLIFCVISITFQQSQLQYHA